MNNHYSLFNPYLWSFCTNNSFIIGNFIKYIARYPYKNQSKSDLIKSLDYLRKIKFIFNQDKSSNLIAINEITLLFKLENVFNEFQNEIITALFYALNELNNYRLYNVENLIRKELEKN